MGASVSAALRAPFPWFGGKRRAADLVWSALGNVDHYVEPFCGSAAVLLARPHVGRCETINDRDGMVSNFWRAVRSAPDAVAHHADWPVLEVDLHARHAWLIGQRESITASLSADPDWFDAKAAGWWVWGACAWIGDGWCGDGRPSKKMPNLGHEGRGLLAPMRSAPATDDAISFRSASAWLSALSQRLTDVRAACGDWRRVVGPSVLLPPSMPSGAVCGVFLDPPYLEGNQQYAAGGTGTGLSAEVRAWAIEAGQRPDMRVILAGLDGEHDMPTTWRVVPWKARGGYGSQGATANDNRHRETLWLSPACIDATKQRGLFDTPAKPRAA